MPASRSSSAGVNLARLRASSTVEANSGSSGNRLVSRMRPFASSINSATMRTSRWFQAARGGYGTTSGSLSRAGLTADLGNRCASRSAWVLPSRSVDMSAPTEVLPGGSMAPAGTSAALASDCTEAPGDAWLCGVSLGKGAEDAIAPAAVATAAPPAALSLALRRPVAALLVVAKSESTAGRRARPGATARFPTGSMASASTRAVPSRSRWPPSAHTPMPRTTTTGAA